MIIKKYREIMQREESHRKNWALGLTISLFLLILLSFTLSEGVITIGTPSVKKMTEDTNKNESQTASLILAPSPLESSKNTFGSIIEEVYLKYNEVRDSLSSVLVPFVTGIDIYERK